MSRSSVFTHEIVFAVKPNPVGNMAIKSTGHSYISLSWVYSEPKPPSLVYRLQYQSERRPAYKVLLICFFVLNALVLLVL